MRRAFLTILAFAFPLIASTNEKIDPSLYTLQAVVEQPEQSKVTTKTGEHNTTGDPRCAHPELLARDAALSSLCQNTTINYSTTHMRLYATIGDSLYTLHGKDTLPPKTYKARFVGHNSEIEFLIVDDKGNPKTVKFKIVGKERAHNLWPVKK